MNNDTLLDIRGRVAVVTGAGQGVGRQIALTLAGSGAKVAVNDFVLERAESVADEIREGGGEACAVHADVGDFEGVGAAFERTRSVLGPVDILVNNAGNRGADASQASHVPFWEQTPADWRPYAHVNFDGVLNSTRFALADMVHSDHGRVITIISDAGRVGEINGLEAYSGVKAGAAGFTRSIARLGGRYGITANCIALGATRTPAIEEALANEELVKRMLGNYIIRRIGEPSDAANLALFLASDASSWITGQTIPVNGGYSMTL
ncbi:SDR family NAD(P)-dependent oxidoreductase [Microbacterium koreense]|uniref:SDR family NAD(P)-dependent oxidoreductase n=1 Tax=Microbacterium koreense TaxID=323761 RepID=A0ABW2ZSZ6_9MICO